MGYGGERISSEVRVLSVQPLDRRREQRVRWLRRIATVAVAAGVVLAAVGPGRDAISDLLDEDDAVDQPVRTSDSRTDPPG